MRNGKAREGLICKIMCNLRVYWEFFSLGKQKTWTGNMLQLHTPCIVIERDGTTCLVLLSGQLGLIMIYEARKSYEIPC